MNSVVRDEIYRVGYEAIRNACVHSHGTNIEVSVEYGHDFIWRIQDNGIGIDAATLTSGKAGHFGLPGMRERAERMRASFTLTSETQSGTTAVLVVPGRIAYQTANR